MIPLHQILLTDLKLSIICQRTIPMISEFGQLKLFHIVRSQQENQSRGSLARRGSSNKEVVGLTIMLLFHFHDV
jgi:hypothetical protein